MANISRNTFEKLKHYVSVRLQQGVPLLDADWNEMEDIRRFELQAFLKWFVGNGVPAGNDGFRILPVAGQIILTTQKHEIEIDLSQSTAAPVLGFIADNARSIRVFASTTELIGRSSGSFSTLVGRILVVKTREANNKPWDSETVTFKSTDFQKQTAATPSEVAQAITKAVQNFAASVGVENDYVIQGGNSTSASAGCCLVEGWESRNESDLRYQAQQLYGSDKLAKDWSVDRLTELTTPASSRTDVVYLDVWEREVDAESEAPTGDPALINPKIGIPTCTRIKREWVVRVVQEFEGDWEKHLQVLREEHKYHVYYGLAQIKWDYTYLTSNERVVSPTITDLRRTELRVPSTLDIKQITTDAYGDTYDLDGDGQPNLKVSLREAINAMLKGGLPSTPDCQLTGGPGDFDSGLTSIRDKAGNILIFWNRLIIDRERQIWYKKYQSQINHWEDEEQLTLGDEEGNFNDSPFTVVDRQGTVWLFWHSYRADTKVIEIRYKCCQPDKELGRYVWSKSSVVTSVLTNPLCSSALVDSQGNIWIFGIRDRGQPQDILGMMYESGKWVDKSPTINEQGPRINFPIAVADSIGVIWLFWMQEYPSHSFIRSQCYTPVKQTWESEVVVTAADPGEHRNISVLCDKDDTLWIFWSPSRDNGFSKYRGNIWYIIDPRNKTTC